MTTTRINPSIDFGFKKIFGEENNKDLLMDFLNELLRPQGVSVKSLTYKKETRLPKNAEDRKVIFDLYCENEHGDKFTIELQKAKQKHFKDRLLYYSTFSIQEQGKRGDWDYELNAVYIIAILDFFFEQTVTKKVVSYYKLLDLDTAEPFTDKLNFVTVEMPHFDKKEDELETNLDKWLYLLKHLGTLDRIPPVLQIAILEKVFKVAEYAGMSKAAKQEYVASLKNYNDLYQSLLTAESDGFDKAKNVYEPQLEESRKREEDALQQKKDALKSLRSTILLLQEMGLSRSAVAKKIGKSETEIASIMEE